ncbi:MAG TPA: TonB-dependent receptor, partial [Albitalea sp.]|nr:TonB-dependent receptor [Albitalea sp.]
MSVPRKRMLALALAVAYPTFSNAAEPASSDAAPQVQTLPEVEISGARQRLDAARNGLSPDTGSSIYRLDQQDIRNLPLGDSTPLNQLILQTPGVVQDSYGQLHIRGDHANVQYRIN